MCPFGEDSAFVAPANPQSWNRYAYVLNNPLRASDSFGLDCVYDEGGGQAVVVTGDCYSETDNGYFVDGTIDTKSQFTLNPDGSLTFGLTDPNGAY